MHAVGAPGTNNICAADARRTTGKHVHMRRQACCLQHLCPSERDPPFHQGIFDQMRRAFGQICLFPAGRQLLITLRICGSPWTRLSSRISPQSFRQYISTGTFLFGLVTWASAGLCSSGRRTADAAKVGQDSPTHPWTDRRRTRRPSSAASRAKSPAQSAGSACAGVRYIAWRAIAPRPIRAGVARARGRCGASTSRPGVSPPPRV